MQTCSDETLIAVLQMLGVDVARPEDAAAARVALRTAERGHDARPGRGGVGRRPAASARPRFRAARPTTQFAVVVEHEAGNESRWTRRELDVFVSRGCERRGDVVDVAVVLPGGSSPAGTGSASRPAPRHAIATLIAAPTRLPRRRNARAWGVFAPVYALHDRGRTETGDLGTLGRLASWVADRGGEVVGTLPILATFVGHGDEPCDPSPYAPVSRRFWNELYLDLRAVPECVPPAVRTSRNLRPARVSTSRSSRPRAARCSKRPSPAWPMLPRRAAELATWLDAHPDARAYAAFRAGREGSGRERRRAARVRAVVDGRPTRGSWRSALDERGQTLYVDLPVGTHREGYDVAARPGAVRRGRIGRRTARRLPGRRSGLGLPADRSRRGTRRRLRLPRRVPRRAAAVRPALADRPRHGPPPALDDPARRAGGRRRVRALRGRRALGDRVPRGPSPSRDRSSARTSARSRPRPTARCAATARSGCGSCSSSCPPTPTRLASRPAGESSRVSTPTISRRSPRGGAISRRPRAGRCSPRCARRDTSTSGRHEPRPRRTEAESPAADAVLAATHGVARREPGAVGPGITRGPLAGARTTERSRDRGAEP